MPSNSRRPKSSAAGPGRDTGTDERFGAFDVATGKWIGRPEELESDEVVVDPQQPKIRSLVNRVDCGIIGLHRSGSIDDRSLYCAGRWFKEWSSGTGHPLRASEMRFLGVSLGGAGDAQGVSNHRLDAATRHR